MDILTDSRPVSRLEVIETGRRRRWSAAEKLRIVEESFSGPRLASATARRHGISNQLLFAWRKSHREGRLGEVGGFVSAVVVPDVPSRIDASAPSVAGRMEIEAANGRRVIVDSNVDVAALLRIVRGLETLR
jgi:transposase